MTTIISQTINIQLVSSPERRRFQVILNGELVAEFKTLDLATAEYVRLGGVVEPKPVTAQQERELRKAQSTGRQTGRNKWGQWS